MAQTEKARARASDEKVARLLIETEALLSGDLLRHLEGKGSAAPGWAWANALAARRDSVHDACRLRFQRYRGATPTKPHASSLRARVGVDSFVWLESTLAAEELQ